MVGYVDQNNDVTQVCEGTNKKDDLAYYLRAEEEDGGFPWAGSCVVECGWFVAGGCE